MPLSTSRRNLIETLCFKEGGRCRYCSGPVRKNFYSDNHYADDATVDHIIPKARGGTNDPRNLALACRRCNQAKGDRSLKEFLADPRSDAERAAERRPGRRRHVPIPVESDSELVRGRPSRNVLPLADSMFILTHGKKAWKASKARPPIEYTDIRAQAAFEGAYANYMHMLRPDDDDHITEC